MSEQRKKSYSSKGMSPEDIERYENFKWCIENDFKVFIRQTVYGDPSRKIVVQRFGITTEGKEGKMVNGRYVKSKFIESKTTYRSQKEANDALPGVYKMLKERYG